MLQNDSWGWKGIIKMREKVLPFIRLIIGNGAATSFWYEKWLADGRLIDPYGDRAQYDLGLGPKVMESRFIGPDWWHLPPPNSKDLMLIWGKIIEEIVPFPNFIDKVV